LVSGGFSWFSNRIATLLGLDYALSNTLEITNGQLTGKVIPPIVNGEMKGKAVSILCEKELITPKDCVSVGDGANDRWMVSVSGLGVAFHAKSILKQATPHHINYCPLNSLGYFLGLSMSQFAEPNFSSAFVEDSFIKHFPTTKDLLDTNEATTKH